MNSRSGRPAAFKVRSDHRAGQGIHRAAGRHRRTLRARAGRTGRGRQAIYDHYKPVSMEDSIPRRAPDNWSRWPTSSTRLRGCFAIGMIPTGSRDPFALRRAAQGVVKILVEGKLAMPLSGLLNNDPQLQEFVLDRVRYYFKEIRGFKYDEVNAVLASGWDDLVDVEKRLDRRAGGPSDGEFRAAGGQLQAHSEHFAAGAIHGRRCHSTGTARARTGSRSARRFRARAERGRQTGSPAALETIASLRPKVDLFFDKVLVNAPDPKVRQNRLALLHAILTESSTIADFSEIVTNS